MEPERFDSLAKAVSRGHPRRWLFRHALGGAVAFAVGGQLAPATAAVCVKPGATGCGRQSKAKCCAGAACKSGRCVCKPGRHACGAHCHPACSGRQRRDPTTCQCPAPSHGRHPRAAAGVAVAIHADYDGQSLLALGVTFDANTLIPGDPAAIDRATAYLAASTTYQNQFTYGWGVYNTEPMPGIYNWASLDKRVALMASMQVQPVLTLVSAPDWMNYLAKPSNTNTISAVASPGSNISVTLGTPISAVSGGTSIIKADTILVDTDPNREQVFVKTAVTDGSRVIGFRADFAKPHPAGTPIVWGFSDFKGHPPTEAHFQEFADLAKATALRYPNVLHFKVWSELRGLWVTANCQYKNQGLRPSPYCADEPGIKNNWDYVAYTNLYNAVYDTLKRVNPNIRVGGPYLPIRHHPQTGPVELLAGEVAAMTYWLNHAHGADFIDFDHSIVNYNDPDAGTVPPGGWTLDQILAQTNTAEDITQQVRAITNGPGGPTWANDLPIWWSEDYFDAKTARVGYAPENFQAAALTSLLLHELKSGASASFRWRPQTDASVGYNGEQESLFSDVKDTTQPWRRYPYATAFQAIHQHFGPGTKLRKTDSSDPSIEALSSDVKTMLINKRDVAVSVIANDVSAAMPPYGVVIMDTPAAPAPNLVANGSFEGAASPWTLGVKSPAAGTLGLDPTSAAAGTSSALIAITSATPGNPYNVQLTQRQIPVVAGGQYALSFAAKADAPRDMVVSCQQRTTPYTVYFRQKNIALTTTWQRFTYTATSTGSDAASMLIFNLSGAAGKVWIDDVQLSCTAGC